MEQWEKNTSDLNIDDILKEFGSSQEETDAPEELLCQEDEDVVVWDGKPVQREKIPPAMPQDTVRLNDITKQVRKQTAATDKTVAFVPVEQDTVAFNPVGQDTVTFQPVGEDTIAFTPVGQEQEPEEPMFIPPQEEKTEPYSEKWEPEYDDPMGEYVPPEPIVFRPKSRLRELKKKFHRIL